MSYRKETSPPPTPWTDTEEAQSYYYNKTKQTIHFTINVLHLVRYGALFFLSLSAAWLVFWLPSSENTIKEQQHELYGPVTNTTQNNSDIGTTNSPFTIPTCEKNMSVYVYNLPPQFNLGLIDQCHNLNMHTDMCPHVANSGLGQPLSNMGYTSWFATHQFTAGMIFHARVENHPCRTWDPAGASLFYVPYYGGLHASSKFHERNLTVRDELDVSLAEFVQSQPWWQKNNGKDHFMTLGRMVWDVMRITTRRDYGASYLLNLPASKNMSVLIIERHPWQGENQHGVPYPSYFHPSTWQEMVMWQTKMRQMERPNLFSFIGAQRKKIAIRNELIRQCNESTRCMFLNCGVDGGSKCQDPSEVLGVMTESRFCLQAPGDTFTRRSTFDSVLAGCIPVFFSRHTAYTQYAWYLPENSSTYSVYIDANSNSSKTIEEELLKISSDKVKMLRETIIDLIPSLTYAHPNATNFGFGDAVDVALASLAKKVMKLSDDYINVTLVIRPNY